MGHPDFGESKISLTTNHPQVPTDARNTAWKMVELALARMGVAAEVAIHIEKELPVQGGMGAGSANAAAALIGLERELVALPEAERLELAAEVGSDVPLFLIGGAVLGTGRGEQVAAMQDLRLPGRGGSAGGWSVDAAGVPGVGWAVRGGGGECWVDFPSPPDRLEELSHVYASVLGFRPATERTSDTSGIVRGPGRNLRGQAHRTVWPGILFSRLSAPGSKTTLKKSSFLSIPSCVKSSDFDGYLGWRVFGRRSG